MKFSVVALASVALLPAFAWAEAPSHDVCRDIKTRLQAQNAISQLSQLPGIETDHVINDIDVDTPLLPILQSEKARLLEEAASADPTRVDLWRIAEGGRLPPTS